MTLTSHTDLVLVGVSSPLADEGELHDMRMDGNGVMRMRALDVLLLRRPDGKLLSQKATIAVATEAPAH